MQPPLCRYCKQPGPMHPMPQPFPHTFADPDSAPRGWIIAGAAWVAGACLVGLYTDGIEWLIPMAVASGTCLAAVLADERDARDRVRTRGVAR